MDEDELAAPAEGFDDSSDEEQDVNDMGHESPDLWTPPLPLRPDRIQEVWRRLQLTLFQIRKELDRIHAAQDIPLNIMICGPKGVGKTALLMALKTALSDNDSPLRNEEASSALSDHVTQAYTRHGIDSLKLNIIDMWGYDPEHPDFKHGKGGKPASGNDGLHALRLAVQGWMQEGDHRGEELKAGEDKCNTLENRAHAAIIVFGATDWLQIDPNQRKAATMTWSLLKRHRVRMTGAVTHVDRVCEELDPQPWLTYRKDAIRSLMRTIGPAAFLDPNVIFPMRTYANSRERKRSYYVEVMALAALVDAMNNAAAYVRAALEDKTGAYDRPEREVKVDQKAPAAAVINLMMHLPVGAVEE